MFDPLHVKAGEHGVVRVFTTDLEPEGDAAITPKNIERLIGRDVSLDPKKVEVFPARMIESISLTGYLAAGYGVRSQAMAGKAGALNGLKGLIVLIPSSAFRGEAVDLDPNPAIKFVGAFDEEKAPAPVRMSHHDTAEGGVSPSGLSPEVRASRSIRQSWIIALAALIGAAALVLFFVF